MEDGGDTDAVVTGWAANGQPPSAGIFHDIAVGINHVAGRHLPVLFNQAIRDSMLPAHPAGDLSPMYQFRFRDDWEPFKFYHTRVIALQPTGIPSGNPRYRTPSNSDIVEINSIAPTTQSEERTIEHSSCSSTHTVATGYLNRDVDTFDDMRALSFAVVGRPADNDDPLLDTDDAGVINPNQWRSGAPIRTTADLDSIRNALAQIWLNRRRVFAAWHAVGTSTTATNMVTITATTKYNILDVAAAITSQTADTPGFFCPIVYCGRYGATEVQATVHVYAQTAGSVTGTVRFTSRHASNTIDVSVSSSGTAAWYSGSSKLALGHTINNEYEKVDVLADISSADGGATKKMRIWGISIVEDPD